MMNKALHFMFSVVKHFRQILYCTRDESIFNFYQATSFPVCQARCTMETYNTGWFCLLPDSVI